MRTDWSRLVEYLQDLHVGEQRRISIEELRRIVRTDEVPPSVSRITLWDPLMGRTGGLQKALLESLRLREQINLLYPEVNDLAMNLGVSVVFQSYPAPAIGGPVLPVNVLLSVVDQEMGHKPIETQMILDMIDRCIGTAKVVKRRSLKRLLIPWYWLIDVPTIIVRFPFLILRNAGLPATVEENIVSQVIKAILVIVILAIGAYFGIQIGVSDLLKLFGK